MRVKNGKWTKYAFISLSGTRLAVPATMEAQCTVRPHYPHTSVQDETVDKRGNWINGGAVV